MACEACDAFDTQMNIRLPSELVRILEKLKAAVSAGKLKYNSLESDRVPMGQSDFTALEPAGPHPDVLQYYFACPNCGCMFELTADTYHGSGGTWKKCS